jgi:hypothetical protein
MNKKRRRAKIHHERVRLSEEAKVILNDTDAVTVTGTLAL